MIEPDDEFRVVSWNVEHNGVDHRTMSEERWHIAMAVLADLKPHVVLRQELTNAAVFGRRALWAEADRLGGFIPFLAAPTPESPNATGVYVDPRVCTPVEYHEHATGLWHPICNPVVRLKGAPRKLSVASGHLCSHDPDRRVNEARRLVTLGKPGMATLFALDSNSYPHTPTEAATLPVWKEVEDRTHFECRTIDEGGKRISDTRPDRILAGTHDDRPPVFVELGQYAATVLGQSDALTPTASLWRKDQGPRQRIDRFYATPQVAAALVKLEVVINDQVRAASDHAAVLATFSHSGLLRALTQNGLTAAA